MPEPGAAEGSLERARHLDPDEVVDVERVPCSRAIDSASRPAIRSASDLQAGSLHHVSRDAVRSIAGEGYAARLRATGEARSDGGVGRRDVLLLVDSRRTTRRTEATVANTPAARDRQAQGHRRRELGARRAGHQGASVTASSTRKNPNADDGSSTTLEITIRRTTIRRMAGSVRRM